MLKMFDFMILGKILDVCMNEFNEFEYRCVCKVSGFFVWILGFVLE